MVDIIVVKERIEMKIAQEKSELAKIVTAKNLTMSHIVKKSQRLDRLLATYQKLKNRGLELDLLKH